jgi:heme oxygenase (biliverdin-IX-beta and delta-forming)
MADIQPKLNYKTFPLKISPACNVSTVTAPQILRFGMDKNRTFDIIVAQPFSHYNLSKSEEGMLDSTALMTLPTATLAIHERLHAHPAMASLVRGDIDRAEYSALLSELYSFHKFYSGVSNDAPLRCARLINDLTFVSPDHVCIEQAAYSQVSTPLSHAERWGVEYVLSGAAMGGKVLAGKLDHMLGKNTFQGRSFFIGDGPERGTRWREFVQALEEALPKVLDKSVAAKAALHTFEHFENCMNRVVAERTGGEQ